MMEQVAVLQKENADLKQYIVELEQQNRWLKERINLGQKQKFGASSEKSEYDFAQLNLFNEAEFFANEKAEEPKLTVVKEHYRKTRLTTDKLPPDLPVEIVECDLTEGERDCLWRRAFGAGSLA